MLAVVLVHGGTVEAQLRPGVVQLAWEAPPGCPGPDSVLAEIGRLVREPPADAPPVEASIRIEEGAGQFALRMTTRIDGEEGERDIVGESCEAVAASAALILALLVDPGALVGPEPEEPPPPLQAEPRRPPSNERADALGSPLLAPDAPRTRRWRVAALGLLDIGSLPGVAGGGEVELAARFGPARVEASVRFFPRRRTGQVPTAPSFPVGAELRLFSAGARGCWSFTRGRFELGPCLGIELGAMSGVATGVSSPQRGRTTWLAATLGAGFSAAITELFGVRLIAELAIPARRPDFELTGGVVPVKAHEPAAVSVRLAVGPELHF